MIEQTKREKMLQRILNLRARAEDNGSSEAEMNTALTMAMKLMESYNVEEAELAQAESSGRIELDIVQKTADTSLLKGKKQKHKIINCLVPISKFTETEVIVSTYSGNITFTGHRPDTELANYLVAVIREALDREFENWKRSTTGGTGYGAKASFQYAMTCRINSRLQQMIDDRAAERAETKAEAERLKIENGETASSTALVICEIAEQKAEEVKNEFRKAHPRTSKVAVSNRASNRTAHGAGTAAGSRVNLGRAISGGSNRAIAS